METASNFEISSEITYFNFRQNLVFLALQSNEKMALIGIGTFLIATLYNINQNQTILKNERATAACLSGES